MECWILQQMVTPATGHPVSLNYNNGLRMKIIPDDSSAHMIFSGIDKLSAPFTPNILHHIVFTCTSSVIKIYIDGVLTDSLNSAGWPGLNGNYTKIGAAGSSSNIEYFKGYISNVALYNKELSAERILAHYNAGIA